MYPCPYCGEQVQADARLCRHCSNSLVCHLVLEEVLDDRQRHRFYKIFQNLEKKGLKSLLIPSYSDSKQILARPPIWIAWDLTRAQAEEFKQNFPDHPLEIRYAGISNLPSFQSAQENLHEQRRSQGIVAAIYGGFALLSLSVVLIFAWFWTQHQPAPQEISSLPKPPTGVDVFVQDSNPDDGEIELKESRQDGTNNEEPKRVNREEMDTLLDATVFISDDERLGSGFFISRDGYILTNYHVVEKMTKPIVTVRDGRMWDATKVKEDKDLDLALLKISVFQSPFLKLGNANDLIPGQSVFTIGNPAGLSFTVTKGIVSYVGRELKGVLYIQTDAAINRGNSGGPMLNEKFEVVGINTLTATQEQGISFALPINFVCSTNGFLNDVFANPPRCQEFRVDDLVQSSKKKIAKKSPASNSESAGLYDGMIKSLKEEMKLEEQRLEGENLDLQKRINDLKSSLAKDPYNASLNERMQPQLHALQKQIAEIPRKKIETQARYIQQMISVLQQQKADPAYSASAAKIEEQIDQLQNYRRQLSDALAARP